MKEAKWMPPAWPQHRPCPPRSEENSTGCREREQSLAGVAQDALTAPGRVSGEARQCCGVGPRSIQRKGWSQVLLSLDGLMGSGVSEWDEAGMNRWSCWGQSRALTNTYSRMWEYCSCTCALFTHLPHLLQLFPSFSSLYSTFHKTFCVLLVTVLCPVIEPFCLCTHVHIAPRYRQRGPVVYHMHSDLFNKRCHYSTFPSLPEIKFPKCVQIPSFSCKCTPWKLKQQHKDSRSCRKYG